jgi:hypothetical protein
MFSRNGLSSRRTWESGKAVRSGSAADVRALCGPAGSGAAVVADEVMEPAGEVEDAACADGSKGEGRAVTAAAADAANTI